MEGQLQPAQPVLAPEEGDPLHHSATLMSISWIRTGRDRAVRAWLSAGWAQQDYAARKVSALANYRLDGFSAERLMAFLAALDQDVEIVIRYKPRSRATEWIIVNTA